MVIYFFQFDENKALEYSKQLPQLKTDDVNIENVLRFNWTSQTKLKKVLAKADQQYVYLITENVNCRYFLNNILNALNN